MIKFKQKEFWGNAIMIGTTALGLGQGAAQMKESKEQAEEQERLMRIQNAKLEKVAEAAKSNPAAANAVVGVKQGAFSDIEAFHGLRVKRFAAVNPGFWKNATGFAKDLWRTQKGNVGKAIPSALAFGGLGYVGNRVVTSMKDHDTGNDDKNKSFLKKAAITGALAAGAAIGARRGAFGNTVQGWAKKNLTGQAINKAINPIQRKADGKLGVDGGKVLMGGLSIGLPVVSYLGQRKQIKEQAQQTDEAAQQYQKQYSGEDNNKKSSLLKGLAIAGTVAGTVAAGKYGLLGGHAQRFIGKSQAGIGGLMRSSGMKTIGDKMAKSGSGTWTKGLMRKEGMTEAAAKASGAKMYRNASAGAVGSALAEGAGKLGSFFGFYGKGGKEAVKNTAKNLVSGPEASGSTWSKNVSDFIQKHPSLSTVGAGGLAFVGGNAIMRAGEKPFRTFDKHAYDSEKENNQPIS